MALSAKHEAWLEERGLSAEACEMAGWRTSGPSIAIPYVKDGVELYAKHRNPSDKKLTRCVPAGIDQDFLYNVDCLKDDPQPSDVLIITEGEPDAEAVRQSAFQFVVSLPSGAASTEEGCRSKAERVLTVAGNDGPILRPEIAKFRRVVVLTDGDRDGILMRQAIVSIIGEEYCLLPTYPEGTKDANDVKRKPKEGEPDRLYGVEGVRALVESAKPVRDDGFIDFVTAAKTKKRQKVYEIGIDWLKPHMKWTVPEFVVIGGEGGTGKTTIYQSLVYSFLWENPFAKASILHLEGDPWIPYVRAKRFWRDKSGKEVQPDSEGETECHDWMRDRLAYIKPPQDQSPTFEWLLWSMEMQHYSHGRTLFVIDPWNEITHRRPKHINYTDYIGDCIIRMKALADRLGLILIVCHHIAKRKDYSTPPSKMDLADSAHWSNKADHVLLAWRPWVHRYETRIEIAKSKDYDTLGHPGHVWVQLNSHAFRLDAIGDPIAAEKEKAAEERKAEREKAAAEKAAKGNGRKANGYHQPDFMSEIADGH